MEVRDDLLTLAEGDRVPADAVLLLSPSRIDVPERVRDVPVTRYVSETPTRRPTR